MTGLDTKKCTKCGSEGPFSKDKGRKDGLQVWCNECLRARTKAWRSNNPGKVKGYTTAWRERNPDWFRSEGHKASTKAWQAKTRPRARLAEQRWYAVHQESVRNRNAKRRADFAKVENTLTTREWKEVLQLFNRACAYCLRPNIRITMDHIVPICLGGGHTKENVVPACRPCNARKWKHGILHMANTPIFQT